MLNTQVTTTTQPTLRMESQVRDISTNTDGTWLNFTNTILLRAYTDGSCFENRYDDHNTPAGCGYYKEAPTQANGPAITEHG